MIAFCTLLLDNGQVYTWGRCDLGQLGRLVSKNDFSTNLDKPNYDPFPGLVDFNFEKETCKIVDICCGSEHTLALTSDGSVWAWGWNEHGMCGVFCDELIQKIDCNWSIVNKPKLIKIDNFDNLCRFNTRIGCGYGHSLLYFDG